ncbi:hypothetical protein TNCV_4550241 [Trichonephila clavipes]|nr:hypothetical protein TNCV_4550241 [Trichonephila clavipes]
MEGVTHLQSSIIRRLACGEIRFMAPFRKKFKIEIWRSWRPDTRRSWRCSATFLNNWLSKTILDKASLSNRLVCVDTVMLEPQGP